MARVGARIGHLGVAALGLLGVSCLSVPSAGEQARAPKSEAEAPAGDTNIAWVARKPGELYRRGEVRAFEIVQGGERIGTSWGRYVGPEPGAPDHHRFETRIEIEIPGRVVRSTGRIVLDERGHLVRGFERSEAAEIAFERNDDAIVLSLGDGSAPDEIAYAPERDDAAVMAHAAILHEELMFGLRDLPAGEVAWRLVSLSGGPPQAWTGRVTITDRREPVTARIETSLGETIVFRGGRIMSLTAAGSDLEIREVPHAKWPAWTIEGPRRLAYAPPEDATFSIRELELPGRAGEPVLWGEVTIPEEGKGPFPGVVFVSSTGQEDRHGFAGPPPVDLGSHEITDALAGAGFVVMRFDERGRGKSEAGAVSFDEQVEDARRAYRTLLVQPEVDPDRIVLVGHGEGGLRALAVAAGRGGAIRGVALLATPGRPYRELFLHQARATLSRLPPTLRKDALEQQEAMLDAIAKGQEAPPELADQARWIREIMAVEPASLVGRIDGALFIAQGGKDFEVDPAADSAALVGAARRKQKRYRVERYPDLDHLFKLEPEQSSPARYLEGDRPVDATFLAHLVAWAREVSGTSGRAKK
jgi:pimeloyl-ACP methyl ester carboxylesterase